MNHGKKGGDLLESKLFKVWCLLGEDENKPFTDWLKSPFYNSNKKLSKLHSVLSKERKKIEEGQFSKERLYQKLYPGQAYQSRTLNNLMAKGVEQLEAFFKQQELRRSEQEQQELLRRAYQRRGEQKRYLQLSQELMQNYEGQAERTYRDDLAWVLLQEEHYFQEGSNKHTEASQALLVEMGHRLDQFYAISRLRIYHEILLQKSILKDEQQMAIDFALFATMKERLHHPVVDLFYERLTRPTDWTLQHFIDYRALYLQFFDQLPPDYQKLFYASIMNDLVALFSKGDLKACTEMLRHMQFGIEQKLLLEEGKISQKKFINFVQSSTLLREEEFIRRILPDYLPLLAKESQDPAGLWAEAQIAYSQGYPRRCLDLIGQWPYKDSVFTIVARVSRLKALFDLFLQKECSETSFDTSCKAFDKYIQRQAQQRNSHISAKRARGYLRFIRLTRKVAYHYIKDPLDRSRGFAERIKQQMEEEEQLIGKLWLLGELEKREA